jgi:hypothetical protein
MRKSKEIARSAVGPENRPQDYFHRRPFWRPFSAGTYFIAILSIICASVYFYFGPFEEVYMNGTLSLHHTNVSCHSCHVEAFSSVSDQACYSCHQNTIEADENFRAIHHPFGEREVAHCAFCHVEHEGDIALDAIDDHDCTRCHAVIPEASGARVTLLAKEVGDHSEFQLWKEGKPTDPGRLKFSHKFHLNPDGVLAGTPSDAENKRVMTCSDCHEMDFDGEYMLPIDYEKHCGSCHAHTLHALENGSVPHEDTESIRAFLFQYFNAYPPRVDDSTEETRTMPQRRDWLDEQDLEKSILARVKLEEENLYGRVKKEGYSRCDQCHFVVQGMTTTVESLAPLPHIEPTNILTRWYSHAKFDHEAHFSSKVDCELCHRVRHSEIDVGAPIIESASATDVLIPPQAVCVECHTVGKESHNCSFCHTFHPEKNEPFEKSRAAAALQSLGRTPRGQERQTP